MNRKIGNITLNEYGKYVTSFYVPEYLKSHIVGKNGETVKNIIKETNTTVVLTKVEEVTIIGPTERSVEYAHFLISRMTIKPKQLWPKVKYFLSVPLINETTTSNLKIMIEDILSNPPRGVTANMFTFPQTLHLNLVFLSSLNEKELESTKKIMDKCYEEIISKLFPSNKKYTMLLRGLEVFEEPSQAELLYIKVFMEDPKENEQFQLMASKIQQYLQETKLVSFKSQERAFRVVLMNRFYQGGSQNQTFDASGILEKFGHFELGNVELRSIHLSITGTATNCYYDAAHIINI